MADMPPPIDDRLLRIDRDGTITLLGRRDPASGRIHFPCIDRDDPRPEVDLPRSGRLWSWTVQRFRPKSPPYAGPEAFEPYAVGYVVLEDAVIVEGRLTGAAIDGHAIGASMRLVAEPFTSADGTVRTTFAFAPTGDAAA